MTLVDHPPTAEAAVVAPTLGVDHLRQGGDDATTGTTSPNRTDPEVVTVLGGQLAVRLLEGAIRTEAQLHWDG